MSSPDLKFLSMKVLSSRGPGGSPLLLSPYQQNKGVAKDKGMNNNEQMGVLSLRGESKSDSKTISWGLRIDVTRIPTLPLYYKLQSRNTLSVQHIPIKTVECRISDFLRLRSVSFTFDSNAVRLDCETCNMLRFSVQFWLVSKRHHHQARNHDLRKQEETPSLSDDDVTLEVQRLTGLGSIEMQTIRRELFRFILTGKVPAKPANHENKSYGQQTSFQIILSAPLEEANKKFNPEQARQDAIEICLGMLESPSMDQTQLGLESLKMLTDPSVVSKEDAVTIAQEIVAPTTDVGCRLQSALVRCFGVASSWRAMDDDVDSIRSAYFAQWHNMALAILGQVLQLVVDQQQDPSVAPNTFRQESTSRDFWQLVTQDIVYNIERAAERPHEGSMSARCLRLLSLLKDHQPVQQSLLNVGQNIVSARSPVAFQNCLTQAHRYGQQYHLSLEEESQKLMEMDIDRALMSH